MTGEKKKPTNSRLKSRECVGYLFNSHHPDPHDPETGEQNDFDGEDRDGMFRFEKRIR